MSLGPSLVRRRAGLAEALLIAGLLAVALAVRLPYLWEIPRFTDETAEAAIGLRIARGEVAPLTNRDPYIGPLWNYLLAAGFVAFGPSLWLPRTLVAIAGALTVVPTYLLARSLAGVVGAGRPHRVAAATLAALLLALAPAHIVVSSHIGWSNCLTPLVATLALWLLHRALVGGRPRLLAPAGLVVGLALQTHPTAALLLPGLMVAVLAARPRWFRGPWPWVGVAAVALGAGPLLVANLRDGFAGLASGRAVQAEYTGGEILTPAVYLGRLREALYLLSDSLAGALAETGPLVGPFLAPASVATLLLAAAGIEALARRRDSLPFLALLSFLVLLPIVNGRFESSVPKARYVAPLLPLCFAAAGCAVAAMLTWADRALAAPGAAATRGARIGRPVARLAVVTLALLALAAPLPGLEAYYRLAVADGRTNVAFADVVAAIRQRLRPEERVYVERGAATTYTLGGGQWNEHLAFAAVIYGWDRQSVELPHPRARIVQRLHGPLLIRESAQPLVGRYWRVEPVGGVSTAGTPIRLLYASGPQPQLLAAERRDERDGIPRPARPPRVELFVDRVAFPSSLQFAPDGRLFFNEVLEGRVRIAGATGELQAEPFVTLPTTRGLEQGALGLALDPEFAANRWVYVFYSEADAENRPVRNRVVRFTERDGRATDATAILGDLPINQTAYFNGDHNGGKLAFGRDGMLYVSVGEMVRRSLVPNRDTVYGKILRVTRDGAVPPDNPFPPHAAFASGFRNVFGLAVHPQSGRIFATDNGPDGFDELNVVRAGRDYGYPSVEGGPAGVAGLEDPIWDSGEERLGITGLAFYTGTGIPEYTGDLFFCAFNTGALRRVRLAGADLAQVEWAEVVAHDCRLDVTTGPDGALYFSDLARIFRLVP